jgi:hypothetical protein
MLEFEHRRKQESLDAEAARVRQLEQIRAENELLLADKHKEERKERYKLIGCSFIGIGMGILLVSSL